MPRECDARRSAGWWRNPGPSRWALPQSLLMRDFLGPFEKQMIALEEGQHDIIGQTALLWKILYYVVLEYKQKNKDWLFLRHEDMA